MPGRPAAAAHTCSACSARPGLGPRAGGRPSTTQDGEAAHEQRGCGRRGGVPAAAHHRAARVQHLRPERKGTGLAQGGVWGPEGERGGWCWRVRPRYGARSEGRLGDTWIRQGQGQKRSGCRCTGGGGGCRCCRTHPPTPACLPCAAGRVRGACLLDCSCGMSTTRDCWYWTHAPAIWPSQAQAAPPLPRACHPAPLMRTPAMRACAHATSMM